ncbi:MAG TPA: glycerol-3-phosphate 1-O-acyltransferase PlsY [Candidatus Eisenbacteria bacterium]|jgi:glycerol-3-phosphate acyltransferase PlsY|nr:glycerol-3-phosphate 1-O-acyltransferase PlsY [Candidatus Eisenbacteria bacterium]
MRYIVVALTAYLLGSIPTGYLVARAKGVDIRSLGSGNIGATNVFRVLGKPAGIAVLVFDGLKGFAACAWMSDLIIQFFKVPPDETVYLRLAAALAVILGHNYTCWLHFKGGKGIATSAGVLAGVVPWSLVIGLAIWIIMCAVTRYVSVGSLAASVTLPFTTWLTTKNWTLTAVTAAMSALAIYKHKGNIQRLLKGTENRLGSSKK